MKSVFTLERQQIIPSPQNMLIGHGILLLGAPSVCGQPSGLGDPSLKFLSGSFRDGDDLADIGVDMDVSR